MFYIEADNTIHLTRGDVANLVVSASSEDKDYEFQMGDVVRFKVFKKRDCGCVELQKDVVVSATTKKIDIYLNGEDTKIGDLISKPTNYWYEIELNPDTTPQTIIGYDDAGEKVFRLYPEGSDRA